MSQENKSTSIKKEEKQPVFVKVYTPSGCKIVKRRKRVYDEKRKRSIVKVIGEYDLYEEIQASNNSTDLEILKRQAASTGLPMDPSGVGYGVNLSLFPSDIHEAFEMNNHAAEIFNTLPEDFRKSVFGDKVSTFVSSLTDGSYNQKVKDFYSKKIKEATAKADKAKNEGGAE